MLKKILALVAMLYAAACFAAVDVNKATAAELDSIKGIGPAISSKIIDERKKGDFKDWQDFVDRVKGVGDRNAAKFSTEGLTVNGASFKGAAARRPRRKKRRPTPRRQKEAKNPRSRRKPRGQGRKEGREKGRSRCRQRRQRRQAAASAAKTP